MSGDGKTGGEEFLARWSRLKQEAASQPPVKPQAAARTAEPEAPPPDLPPLDKLTMASDFRGFFHPGVDEGLRRSALKKLFADPHFNVMDGLDVYIDDYSLPNPLPAAMLAQLRQAQKIIEWSQQGKEENAARTTELPGAVPVTGQIEGQAGAPGDQGADAAQRIGPRTADPRTS